MQSNMEVPATIGFDPGRGENVSSKFTFDTNKVSSFAAYKLNGFITMQITLKANIAGDATNPIATIPAEYPCKQTTTATGTTVKTGQDNDTTGSTLFMVVANSNVFYRGAAQVQGTNEDKRLFANIVYPYL